MTVEYSFEDAMSRMKEGDEFMDQDGYHYRIKSTILEYERFGSDWSEFKGSISCLLFSVFTRLAYNIESLDELRGLDEALFCGVRIYKSGGNIWCFEHNQACITNKYNSEKLLDIKNWEKV